MLHTGRAFWLSPIHVMPPSLLCYGSGKVSLTCPRAEKQLLATLKATYIYRDADSFCRVSVVMGHTIIYTIAGRGHATPKFSAQYTYTCTEWHNTYDFILINVYDICILCLVMYIYIHVQCCDTYWVESFNHQLLTYLPKRIHFSTRTFNMRTSMFNVAIME